MWIARFALRATAFEGQWGQTTVQERADWLRKLADALKQRAEQIAKTISQEVGSPIQMSTNIQAGLPVLVTNSYAQLIGELKLEQEIGNSLVVREPFGVVGAITPWNYPLHQIMAKVAPALGAGCTVVLKPSEVAPLNALLLAEACEAIGLPPGVLNIVTGYGPVVGEAIASHRQVDMVSFTGSVRAGKRVAALAGESIKKVTLELGGKSAFVVLDDAPLEKAIPAGARNAMLNSGQTCSAWTRMVVPRSLYPKALELAAQAIGSLKVGDPMDAATRLGPLISATQRERVEGYIAKGKQEGARVVMGGGRPAGFAKGYYVEPTIFADVQSKMTIAQEEIFGPVLSVLPYDTEDEAVKIANDTIYGLAGGVWSGDPERAHARGAPDADGTSGRERREVQSAGAVRRLQTFRNRAGVGDVRAGGIFSDQVDRQVEGYGVTQKMARSVESPKIVSATFPFGASAAMQSPEPNGMGGAGARKFTW